MDIPITISHLVIWAPPQFSKGHQRCGVPIINIMQSWYQLIFIMGIPLPVRRHIHFESVPCRRHVFVNHIRYQTKMISTAVYDMFHICAPVVKYYTANILKNKTLISYQHMDQAMCACVCFYLMYGMCRTILFISLLSCQSLCSTVCLHDVYHLQCWLFHNLQWFTFS